MGKFEVAAIDNCRLIHVVTRVSKSVYTCQNIPGPWSETIVTSSVGQISYFIVSAITQSLNEINNRLQQLNYGEERYEVLRNFIIIKSLYFSSFSIKFFFSHFFGILGSFWGWYYLVSR
jgi:hypothetical protein